jgi:hypothetical protein
LFHSHAHYEELCGLAATGQMPENEAAGFRAHLTECQRCRSLVEDFARVGAFLIAGRAEKTSKSSSVPVGMAERFVARARSEGISINSRLVEPRHTARGKWKPAAAVAIAASLLLAGFFTAVKLRPPRSLGQSVAVAVSPTSIASALVVPGVTAREGIQAQVEGLQQQLSVARAAVNLLSARMKADRNALDTQGRDLASLQATLHGLEGENASLKAGAGDRAAEVARLQGEIEKLSSVKRASDIAVLAEENELRNLRQTLLDKEAALRRMQELVDAGNQIRDLVVDRNFHMFDVYDRDGDGKQQRAFGRIFYSEGKSLVFYAYDLTDPRKVDQQVSFYAWGERLGGGQPVKRLGIFHSDDANEGRWVLTFDDPHVLAQINSVFVTAEREKHPITTPKGKEILFAFMGNKATHP